MSVLLSIRPEHAESIITGKKKYEFRKSRLRLEEEHAKAYIYTTAPVRKIVAVFKIEHIYESHPRTLWRKFGDSAGIDVRTFSEYFKSRKKGFAIQIGDLKVFRPPIEPKMLVRNFVPPQSFRYVNGVASKRTHDRA